MKKYLKYLKIKPFSFMYICILSAAGKNQLIPDLSSFPEDKMQFLNISDRNDQPDAYKVYRAQGGDL